MHYEKYKYAYGNLPASFVVIDDKIINLGLVKLPLEMTKHFVVAHS